MRIIAGIRRGLLLSEFHIPGVRPTSDKVKGAVFNMLMNLTDISSCRVLDLYAGTGNLGLEALSRGALSACFVEKDPKVMDILRQNIRKAQFETVSEICQQDAMMYINVPPASPFDLIFADPPYQGKHGETIVYRIFKNDYLSPAGFLVLETSVSETIEYDARCISLIKDRVFRETRIRIFGPIRSN